jgi:anti-sigma factor RsiW
MKGEISMKSPCSKWSRRVSAWFDGEVSEMDAAEVRTHLLECPGCRNAVVEWGKQRNMLDLLQPEEPSPELVSAMTHRFETGLAAEVHRTSAALRMWTRVAAAAFLVSASFLAVNSIEWHGEAAAASTSSHDEILRSLTGDPDKDFAQNSSTKATGK